MKAALDRAVHRITGRLLEFRTAAGPWQGTLSSSALSTATASMALTLAGRGREHSDRGPIQAGLDWLIAHQNQDGGWGDTIVSFSNLSTTMLCWSALTVSSSIHPNTRDTLSRAETWLQSQIGDLHPDRLKRTILERYGKDRTFSVPILTVLAIAGKLGASPKAWRAVPQLPFELAAFPHRWFQWLRLPVVSYALPALVAIGQVRHYRAPSRNLLARPLRSALRKLTLAKARAMQPASGGYLEATPLTAFVVMSLIESGQGRHPIVADGLRFLRESVRPDGSWPIDSNLSTWVTTLSIRALSENPAFSMKDRETTLHWLIKQQFREEHPFTHALPGGWAWTDLSGGVPDADDTSGALLALRTLAGPAGLRAAVAGIGWLLKLQNTDGGMPTFCKGWGALPFDRSAPDLTAHALEAWNAWHATVDRSLRNRMSDAAGKALAYLERQQQADGSWIPLWFGNQHAPGDDNPTYGTARVVSALGTSLVVERPSGIRARQRGVDWLLQAQNPGGGWGGATQTSPSIEETALALDALAGGPEETLSDSRIRAAIERGTRFLIEITEEGQRMPAAPIGLYFARLWYYEDLYPLVFALRGLAKVRAYLERHELAE